MGENQKRGRVRMEWGCYRTSMQSRTKRKRQKKMSSEKKSTDEEREYYNAKRNVKRQLPAGC